MKKNLRIVSAAAAALLAVAPIAASSVTANAAEVLPGGNVTNAQPIKQGKYLNFSSNIGNETLSKAGFDGFVDLKNFNLNDFLSDSNIEKNITVESLTGKDVNKSESPKIVGVNSAKITKEQNGGEAVSSFVPGHTYYLQAEVTVNGLSKTTSDVYQTNANTEDVQGAPSPTSFNPSNQGTVRNLKIAVELHFYNSEGDAQPFFKSTANNNNAYNNDQTIEAPKSAQVIENNKIVTKNFDLNTAAGRYDSLHSLGLDSYNSSSQPNDEPVDYNQVLNANNWQNWENVVNAPSATRTVRRGFTTWNAKSNTLTLHRVNLSTGKFATLNVYFGSQDQYNNYPLIKYSLTKDNTFNVQQGLNNFNNAMPIAVVQKGNLNWASDLIKKFSAQQSTNNSAQLPLTTEALSIDNGSTMDINKEGLHKATLTAKNSNGYTTTLNFTVAVSGDGLDELSNQFVTGKANEVIKLVSIVDGKVSNQNGTVVNQGQPIVVYVNDKKTVDGVEYTRVATTGLSREQSNLWIPTTNLQAAKPAQEEGVTKRVMHNAYLYTKAQINAGKSSHEGRVTRYNNVSVLKDTYSINGGTYYKVANKDQYIAAGNIDGKERTLKHNAYVYKTSKKRANKKVLKKGTKVTTFGASYKFANGKRYYKVFDNTDKTYVKVASFE